MERYEAYKDSGVEWIGEIPVYWLAKRIKSLIRDLRVGPFGSAIKTDDYCDEGVPLYTQETVLRDDWTISKHITNEKASELQSFAANPGDYLITTRGTLGRVYELPSACENGIIHPCLMRFRIDVDCVDGSFLKYALNDSNELIEQVLLASSSSTIPVLYSETLRNAYIAVPPIHHQQAIADYLDAMTAEVDALVADCEREVELLREYRRAVISEAVTKGLDPDAPMKDTGVEWIGEIPDDWEVVGFKTYLSGIIDYRGRTPEKVDDGVFLITGRNIKQGRIHYDLSQEYMRPEDFDTIMSRGRLKVGNVLFTLEAPLGEAALIDREDCAAAQRIIQLCCDEDELCGAFLVYWIMSDGFQSDLQTYATGSTASGIKASKLGMLRLMHPPMEIQRSIVDYLDAKTAEIDFLIEAKLSMADKLREYRKSLISEAVTGKFKVPGAGQK